MGLKLCSAGAGSGKTHSICEEVVDAIVHRGIDPAMVLATTFTRKAASELKGRIEQCILDAEELPFSERMEKAGRLDLARIGTVHSVGQRFIDTYAFELGLSPELQILEEGSEGRVLRGVMEQMDPEGWDHLLDAAARLGEETPEKMALKILEHARANRIPARDLEGQLSDGVGRLVEVMCEDKVAVALPGRQEILGVLDESLAAIAESGDTTKTTAGAVDRLGETRRRLDTGAAIQWSELADLANVKAAKKADPNLDNVRALGRKVLRCRELHRDLGDYAKTLARQVSALDLAYAEYKRERGLLDFTDLEVRFLQLLEREDLAESLKAELSLVVVDEFQDTNPIQLAIFQRLQELVGDAYWVGDQKQAIYGFRGADANLVEQVWQAQGDAEVQALTDNYRSQAGLVEFVNRLFANEAVYGRSSRLEPKHDAQERAIERWWLQSRNKGDDAAAIAHGVAQLIEDGCAKDDICLLARTNDMAKDLASALLQRGIDAALKLPGLLQTRECALALAGLRVVADRNDSLAAATIFHLSVDHDDNTPSWLEERLKAVRDQEGGGQWKPPWPDSDLLAALEEIDVRDAAPADVLDQVIQTLELDRDCARFGEPQRRLTHLEALLEVARAYQTNARLDGTAPTLSGLIAHLEAEDVLERPAPGGLDAVTVSTVHSAKGLQWPVVILAELDKEYGPRMFDPVVIGGDVAGGRPLAGRRLAYWPWPFGFSFHGRPRASRPLTDLALATEEGQGAADRVKQEELRVLYVAMTRARKRLVLAHRPNKYGWLKNLPTVDEVLDPALEPGEHELEGCQTTVLVRELEPEAPDEIDLPDTCTWIKPPARAGDAPALRDNSPSRQVAEDDGAVVEEATLPGEHPFPKNIRTDDWIALGEAVHAYFAALPSLGGLDPERCIAVARRCLDILETEKPIEPEGLVAAGERLMQWISERFPDSELATEISVVAPRETGGRWTGEIDLLVELPDGELVCIDHKAIPIGQGGWTGAAAMHVGQLRAYREALEALGYNVAGTWIHMPLGGGVIATE
jgi:ATP-dependent exoDNAse (exonuclease V) beta subunit